MITLNVLNVFIQTYLENKNKRIILVLREEIAKILINIAPKIYKQFVEVEKIFCTLSV